jgi:hypothetical protein
MSKLLRGLVAGYGAKVGGGWRKLSTCVWAAAVGPATRQPPRRQEADAEGAARGLSSTRSALVQPTMRLAMASQAVPAPSFLSARSG